VTAVDPMVRHNREDNLPVWARNLVEQLRKRVVEAEDSARRASLSTDPVGSAAILDRYDDPDRLIGLGENPRIAFRVAFPGYRESMSFIEVRPLNGREGITLHAADEIVCRQRAINSVDVVPWPSNKRAQS
jgi:hypothetical protein